jgi:hypothetical protein
MRIARAVVVAAALTLALPAVSEAAWDPVDYFQSKTRNTYCTMYQRIANNRASNKIECGAQRVGMESCVKSYTLRSTGRTMVRRNLCGNSPYEAPRVAYNTWLYIYGGTTKVQSDRSVVRCIFRRASGVTCRNRSGHGFTVRVGKGRTF